MTLLAMRFVSIVIVAAVGIVAVTRRLRALPVVHGQLSAGRFGGHVRGVWPGWPAVGVIALVGWSDAGANGLYGLASRHGLVSVVAVLASLYPAVTVLLARIVENERMRRIQGVGVLCALCGVVLLAIG